MQSLPVNRLVTESVPTGPLNRVRTFLRAHGRKLWWLHSAYALLLGCGVVAFAQKGFDHARWLSVSLGAAWLLVVAIFGSEPLERHTRWPHRRRRRCASSS